MTDISYDEALAQLRGMDNPTIDQLRDLIARTSIDQVDPSVPSKVKILYSGPLANNFYANGKALRAGGVAEAMAKADPSLKIVNNTQVGKLLINDEFGEKLLSIVGNVDEVDNLLY